MCVRYSSIFKHLPNKLDSFGNNITRPICSTQSAPIVPMDNILNIELKQFFIPSSQQVETLISSVNFQYCSLMEIMNYYKSNNVKLNDKLRKIKDLFDTVKEEIDHQFVDLRNLASDTRSEGSRKPSINPIELIKFIENIHKQSAEIMSQAVSPLNFTGLLASNSPTTNQPRSFFVESTKINEPMQSSGSKNSRPLTSQLTSRITANMKIGGSTTLSSTSRNQMLGFSLHSMGKNSTERIHKQFDPSLNRSLQQGDSPYFRN